MHVSAPMNALPLERAYIYYIFSHKVDSRADLRPGIVDHYKAVAPRRKSRLTRSTFIAGPVVEKTNVYSYIGVSELEKTSSRHVIDGLRDSIILPSNLIWHDNYNKVVLLVDAR